MTVVFYDEFNGSGSLIGHIPEVNLLAGEGSSDPYYTYFDVLQMSSGSVYSNTFNGAGAPNTDGAAAYQGMALDITWGWSYADGADLGIPCVISLRNYERMVAAQPDGVLRMNIDAEDEVSAAVSYSAGEVYEGRWQVRDGLQRCEFLGAVLETYAAIAPADMTAHGFRFQVGGPDKCRLHYVKIEVPEVFWTNLRNAQEII